MLPLRIFTTFRSPELDILLIPILSPLCVGQKTMILENSPDFLTFSSDRPNPFSNFELQKSSTSQKNPQNISISSQKSQA